MLYPDVPIVHGIPFSQAKQSSELLEVKTAAEAAHKKAEDAEGAILAPCIRLLIVACSCIQLG